MLGAHLAGGEPAARAAAVHGYSRAAFYLVVAAFAEAGMAGLVDERPGRRGPVKLRPEIAEFIRSAPAASGAALAAQVADRFGVGLHRRTVERARARSAARRSGRRPRRRRPTTRCSAPTCRPAAACRPRPPPPGAPPPAWPV